MKSTLESFKENISKAKWGEIYHLINSENQIKSVITTIIWPIGNVWSRTGSFEESLREILIWKQKDIPKRVVPIYEKLILIPIDIIDAYFARTSHFDIEESQIEQFYNQTLQKLARARAAWRQPVDPNERISEEDIAKSLINQSGEHEIFGGYRFVVKYNWTDFYFDTRGNLIGKESNDATIDQQIEENN